jgi:hypothetical protein
MPSTFNTRRGSKNSAKVAGTLDILLEAYQDLLDAEQAAGVDEPAASQGYWERNQLIENVNKERYAARRIAIQDYKESCYFRLEAEIAWLLAKARKQARQGRYRE